MPKWCHSLLAEDRASFLLASLDPEGVIVKETGLGEGTERRGRKAQEEVARGVIEKGLAGGGREQDGAKSPPTLGFSRLGWEGRVSEHLSGPEGAARLAPSPCKPSLSRLLPF